MRRTEPGRSRTSRGCSLFQEERTFAPKVLRCSSRALGDASDVAARRLHISLACGHRWPTDVDRPKCGIRTRLDAREVHARMHARWPTRFRSDHACSMRVASASAARCTACGCTGRTQVFRREQAEHFGRCKDLPLPCARHLTRCYGLQPAALRTAGSMLMQCSRCCRLDCPPTFAAVQAHPSTGSQPVPISSESMAAEIEPIPA